VLRAAAGGRWAGVTPRTAAFAWVLSAVYGATDEWHQSFVPGRMMTFEDLVADAAGAGLAIAAAMLVARARRGRAV
jgi:VanZ family protein